MIIFQLSLSTRSGWIRFESMKGYSWTIEPPLFSEHYGHKKPLLKLWKFRIFRLYPMSI